MKLVTASPPREWPIRPMREKSSLPTSAPPMFVSALSGIAAWLALYSASSIAEMIIRRWCMPLPKLPSWNAISWSWSIETTV